MDSHRIPVGIPDKCHEAYGCFDGAEVDFYASILEFGDRCIEIIDLEAYRTAVFAGNHAGGPTDRQRSRANVELDPMGTFRFAVHGNG